MTAIPPEKHLPALTRDQLVRAQQAGYRCLFVLSGSEDWCLRTQSSITALLPGRRIWRVSEHSTDEAFICLTAAQLAQKLGQECDVLIWDGFSGMDPDALAAAAGLIRAGGLMLILLPPESELFAHKDPDYRRMCANSDEVAACSSHFLQRLCRVLATSEGVLFLHESDLPELKPSCLTPIPVVATLTPALPTADQRCAIDAIMALHASPTPAVLLLSAQRGRGKSSALGIACARLSGAGTKIILSAASKQHAAIALLHFEREYTRLHGQGPAPDRLTFHAPDMLLHIQPDCDLLLIDEAGMLPVPMLIRLSQHCPKCVFATTTDGYEGTGQGFLLRFRATLTRQARAWQQIELKQPIRWADHDPLERAIHSALILNHERPSFPPESLNPDAATLDWIDQARLAADEPLLQQLVSLLTEAHYQTRPSDLRMLLDHPRIRIATIRQSQHLLAALVLIAEGGIHDAALAEGLIAGTRRPRGHLIPQALTQFSGDARWLELSSWRVMRITVQPELSRQKLGSRLLAAARQHAEMHGLDYLSASFGLTETLLPFWLDNGYSLLRIGYHRDAASACHSAQMALALSPRAAALAQPVQQRFAFVFERLCGSHFIALDTELGAQVRRSLTETSGLVQNPALLRHIAEAHRLIEDTLPELLGLLEREGVTKDLSDTERELLALRIQQGLSWQACARRLNLGGKRNTEQRCRRLVGRLLRY